MANYRRWNYIINKKVQLKNAFFVIIMLILYTVALLSVIFAPYLITLSSDLPLEQKTAAAEIILLLHGNIWIGLICIVILCGAYSIIVTHKMVGPIFAINRIAIEVIKGELTKRTHLRSNDEFKDVADNFNTMVGTLESSIYDISSHHDSQLNYISELESQLKLKNVSQEELKKLEIKHSLKKDGITKILLKFTFRKNK